MVTNLEQTLLNLKVRTFEKILKLELIRLMCLKNFMLLALSTLGIKVNMAKLSLLKLATEDSRDKEQHERVEFGILWFATSGPPCLVARVKVLKNNFLYLKYQI